MRPKLGFVGAPKPPGGGNTKSMSKAGAEALARTMERFMATKRNQTEAGEALGFSQTHVSDVLAKKGAGVGFIEALADAMKISVDEAIGRARPAAGALVDEASWPELVEAVGDLVPAADLEIAGRAIVAGTPMTPDALAAIAQQLKTARARAALVKVDPPILSLAKPRAPVPPPTPDQKRHGNDTAAQLATNAVRYPRMPKKKPKTEGEPDE